MKGDKECENVRPYKAEFPKVEFSYFIILLYLIAMDLKQINSHSSEITIANVFFKLYNSYKQNNSKDKLDIFKNSLVKDEKHCKHSVIALIKLVEDGILELGQVLNILIAAASDAK